MTGGLLRNRSCQLTGNRQRYRRGVSPMPAELSQREAQVKASIGCNLVRFWTPFHTFLSACNPRLLRPVETAILDVMIDRFSKYVVRPAGLLLLVLCTSSLLWCGDQACRSGSGDGECASLVCALMGDQNLPETNQDNSGSTDCMCVCHMPTLAEAPADVAHILNSKQSTSDFTPFAPLAPVRSIYHPPKS